MADTKLTDINITTSVAGYFANKLVLSGWRVYWQATDVFSGTATMGDVTIVPEFPDDPSLMVLPSAIKDTRVASEVMLPAFSLQIIAEPLEQIRAGLGEDLFHFGAAMAIEGFVTNLSEHLAFATMFRNWFREGTVIPMYDYETSPTSPPPIDQHVWVERRLVDRFRAVDPNVPRQARYFLSTQIDLSFFD